jgi:hypothetical protein
VESGESSRRGEARACRQSGLSPAFGEDAALVAGLLVLLAIARTRTDALLGVRAGPGGVRLTVRSSGPARPGDPAAAIAGPYSLALVTRLAA